MMKEWKDNGIGTIPLTKSGSADVELLELEPDDVGKTYINVVGLGWGRTIMVGPIEEGEELWQH